MHDSVEITSANANLPIRLDLIALVGLVLVFLLLYAQNRKIEALERSTSYSVIDLSVVESALKAQIIYNKDAGVSTEALLDRYTSQLWAEVEQLSAETGTLVLQEGLILGGHSRAVDLTDYFVGRIEQMDAEWKEGEIK